jgi:hypothetical protein
MAFTPTKLLQATGPVTLRDQQHAARLFVDDQFRLAPKHKFAFHVAFSINPAALKSIDMVQRHSNEINMLVKKVSLPSYKISTKQVNQYNRKKVIQTQHATDELGITFHDDNMGLINQLWQNYYSYYYADPTSAGSPGAYNRNATRNSDFITTPYGLDNGSTVPFFNYITIYQMARHEYVSYRLINPLISSFDHNKLAYDQTKETNDFDMKLKYEAVEYNVGLTTDGSIEGFAQEHYDLVPSPLQGVSGATNASPSFVTQQSVTTNALDFLNNLSTTINGYENTQAQATNGTAGISAPGNITGLGGLQGIAFPQSAATNDANTVATKVNLGI